MSELEILYKEAMERLEWLESEFKRRPSDVINGRILELNNIIIKIQQVLISKIK